MEPVVPCSDEEIETLEQIISLYKLPFEYVSGPDESTTTDSDYVLDCETGDRYSWSEGVFHILDAVDADSGELLATKLSTEQKALWLKLLFCAQTLNI